MTVFDKMDSFSGKEICLSYFFDFFFWEISFCIDFGLVMFVEFVENKSVFFLK